MNGHLSDLQLRLPWQMVEVHEPVRLILLICCKVEMMETILGEAFGYTAQPGHFQCLVKHNWMYYDKDSRGALAYLALAGELIRREEEASSGSASAEDGPDAAD